MKKLVQILLIGLGFCLLIVALSALTSRPVPAQAPPPSVPVTVVNTTARPVPTAAQGTTTVAGTVAITGTPIVRASIIDTPTVNATITNTPTVNANITNPVSLASGSLSNTASTPLFVRDEAAAGRHPFVVESDNIPGFGAQVILPTLPSGGGTAVIEYVSALCAERAGITLDFIYLITGTGPQNHFILTATGTGIVNPANNAPFQTEVWVGQQTKIYASPGTPVQLLQEHDNGGCLLSLSGYLIPQ